MKQSWQGMKSHIWILLNKISNHYGGDDEVWLIEYARDLVVMHKDNLDELIDCLRNLERQLEFMPLLATTKEEVQDLL